ncbi:hypothetical protein GUITHDRAFT_111804 [Guillardia theta CCMP2712]|uniref:Uncharacterized protein n=3 Tax=Guillardia theta TaxID=55529 RepID=L1J137_GUITC|nr:hypothetical protein GUITHDRAFT_111804 [Guillardia theta CCMP2712]EKX42243.1 hypothetical protein GUITHDRAFT_111804 [Guillardia theta CCMP2712]|eukprot:XP_005829223.1 hypothetical protein GUITHDRAFT_111804 [Guillardia theta CCMP2712]
MAALPSPPQVAGQQAPQEAAHEVAHDAERAHPSSFSLESAHEYAGQAVPPLNGGEGVLSDGQAEDAKVDGDGTRVKSKSWNTSADIRLMHSANEPTARAIFKGFLENEDKIDSPARGPLNEQFWVTVAGIFNDPGYAPSNKYPQDRIVSSLRPDMIPDPRDATYLRAQFRKLCSAYLSAREWYERDARGDAHFYEYCHSGNQSKKDSKTGQTRNNRVIYYFHLLYKDDPNFQSIARVYQNSARRSGASEKNGSISDNAESGHNAGIQSHSSGGRGLMPVSSTISCAPADFATEGRMQRLSSMHAQDMNVKCAKSMEEALGVLRELVAERQSKKRLRESRESIRKSSEITDAVTRLQMQLRELRQDLAVENLETEERKILEKQKQLALSQIQKLQLELESTT